MYIYICIYIYRSISLAHVAYVPHPQPGKCPTGIHQGDSGGLRVLQWGPHKKDKKGPAIASE